MLELRTISVVSAAALALAAVGLAAAPASAQTMAMVSADWETQSLHYMAGEGQANDLYVFPMGAGTGVHRIAFNDEVPIQAGDNCSYIDPADDTMVVCDLPTDAGLPDDIHVFLGDGDDGVMTSAPGVTAVHGGEGDDELHAHTAHTVMGEEGDDMLMGGVVMEGGDGMDHLMGDDRDQELRGGRDMDQIEAFGGADTVYANSGDDHVTGGRGDDFISGGPGDDTVYGNSGADTILGGPGDDTLSGGPDADDVTQ